MTDFKSQDCRQADKRMHVIKRVHRLILVHAPAPNMTESKAALKERETEGNFQFSLNCSRNKSGS